jgi:hypothetical protein
MAFTLEDGTGLSNSNSYSSVAAFKAYHDDRGNSYAVYVDAAIEKALIKATDYIEQRFGLKFRGARKTSIQALSFPRDFFYDSLGSAVGGLPVELVKATQEYAFQALSTSLWVAPTIDATGMRIQSKREVVGPIETDITYQEGAQIEVAKPWPAADALIRTLLSGTSYGVIRN